jgi:hypothetical protein
MLCSAKWAGGGGWSGVGGKFGNRPGLSGVVEVGEEEIDVAANDEVVRSSG